MAETYQKQIDEIHVELIIKQLLFNKQQKSIRILKSCLNLHYFEVKEL